MVYGIYIQNHAKDEYIIIFKKRTSAESAYINIKNSGKIKHIYENLTFYGVLGDVKIHEKQVQAYMRSIRFVDRHHKVDRIVNDDILVINPANPVVEPSTNGG